MLIFADEGGRGGVSGNADVIISSFEKGFFALERQRNTEKTLKFPTLFRIFFKNSSTVLSSVKIQTGEI